jgi:hypothetical protein
MPRAGASFDIAKISAEARAHIPFVAPLPLVVRRPFFEQEDMDDTLGLGEAVDRALAERAADMRRAPFVFVEGGKFSGAYRLLGRYAAQGGKPVVTVRLVLDREPVLDARFEGDRASLGDLAQRIAGAVVTALQKQ